MAGTNGITVLPGGRKPLRVTPVTVPIPIDRNGETVVLQGYVKGPGCPGPILIDWDETQADMEAEQPTADDKQSMSMTRYHARLMRAERMLRAAMLRVVIPGLTEDEANVLAGDGGPWEGLLVELKWFRGASPAEADEDPEAPAPAANAPTGASSSPDSQPLTQASIS